MKKAKNVREQLEADSFEISAALSPAERVQIALELSNLCYALYFATNRRILNERSKKRSPKVFGHIKKSLR